jgi:hypothetical protein
MSDDRPTPTDLGPRGLALWGSIADEFDLPQHEAELLHEAARVADRLDALDSVVRADGVTVATPQGVKAHPALSEARQQEIVLTRLVASLRIPDEDDKRPQRRGAGRGSYSARRQYGSRSVGR